MIDKTSIEKNFIKVYFDQNNIPSEEPLVIALSGGVDSTVLFNLINKNYINKKNIHVIIFDHESRPESSKEIKSIVRLYNLKNTYSLKIYKLGSKLKKYNFQKKSRELRINLITNYSKKYGITNIFFGHHYDDLLETILLRKIQLSGISGLSRIFSKKYNSFNFHRPMLILSKEQILKYANHNKLKWFDDPTNIKNIYTRNKIRNYLLTKRSKKKIESYSKNLNDIPFLNDFLNEIIKVESNKITVNKSVFMKFPLILKKYLLLKVLKIMSSFDEIRKENINNIRFIIAIETNLHKKRSIKGGFIVVSDNKLTFIPNKPFKQKKL